MERIVVGYDGSVQSVAALQWAAMEARQRSAEVVIVRCWHEPILEHRSWVEMWEDPDGSRKAVEADLVRTADQLVAAHPGVSVSHLLLGGDPVEDLVELGGDAALVVLGARGRGGFSSLLLGSVGRRVAADAPTTVVVFRPGGVADGDIVVGVDGLRSGKRALRWAAEEARRRAVRLRVVMAWSYLLPETADGPTPFLAEYTVATARRALHLIVEEVLGSDPGIDIALEVPCEATAKALVERSAGASLLVVGPRDTSMRHRVDLGSVTAQVLQHALVPVAVVHGDADPD